jgi:hypothetical protein
MPAPCKELEMFWSPDHDERAAVYEYEHGVDRKMADVYALRTMGDREDADWYLKHYDEETKR